MNKAVDLVSLPLDSGRVERKLTWGGISPVGGRL